MGENAFGSEIEPILKFKIVATSVVIKHQPQGTTEQILFELLVMRPDSVKRKDGASLNDIDWSLSLFKPSTELRTDWAAKHKDILGFFHFYGVDRAEEGCEIEVVVSDAYFAEVLDWVKRGYALSDLNLRTRGFEYGSDPEGSDKVWDRTSNSRPSVREITMLLPSRVLSSENGVIQHVGEPDDALLTSQVSDSASLSSTKVIVAINSMRASISVYLAWLLIANVVGFAALLWLR